MNARSLLWGFASYALWGFFPLYWKLLADRPAFEILVHRMVWSFAFYALIHALFSKTRLISVLWQSRRDWLLSAAGAALLAVNWGLYIYAVNSGQVLESSLAYFINPILNVLVGVVFFREDFPLILKLSVGFAAAGISARIAYHPGWPWLSLALATTFCAYGVTKKLIRIPALNSSVLEGLISFPPAALVLLHYQAHAPVALSYWQWFLMVMGGVVTGLPLFLFSYAAQTVPYSIMGLLQFIAPSLQFLVAVVAFGEHFGLADAVSFGLIWMGIAFYIVFQAYTIKMRRA